MSYIKPSELAKKHNLPYRWVLEKCKSAYVKTHFAYPTVTDYRGRCIGRYIVHEERFIEALERGYLSD